MALPSYWVQYGLMMLNVDPQQRPCQWSNVCFMKLRLHACNDLDLRNDPGCRVLSLFPPYPLRVTLSLLVVSLSLVESCMIPWNILWNKFYLTLKSHMIRYDEFLDVLLKNLQELLCLFEPDADRSAAPPFGSRSFSCSSMLSMSISPSISTTVTALPNLQWTVFVVWRGQRWENMEKLGLAQKKEEKNKSVKCRHVPRQRRSMHHVDR